MKYQLINEILKVSNSKEWENAKLEWKLDHIYTAKEAQTCLCGHFPIIQICVLRNIKNKEMIFVGNCCVKKFLPISSQRIFNCIKKIRIDIKKSMNKTLLVYLFKKRMITEWEHNYYLDIWRKRKLTDKQCAIKVEINKKVLNKIDQITKEVLATKTTQTTQKRNGGKENESKRILCHL